MRDRLLLYAIVVSVLAHIGVVCVIGRSSASRLQNAADIAVPRMVRVELLGKSAPPSKPPVHTVVPLPPPSSRDQLPPPPGAAHRSQPGRRIGPNGGAAGDPGGRLNLGTPSAHGDIPVGSSGNTPVGWVPGTGSGKGSGTGPGIGNPDPTPNASPGPNTRPAPPPVDPTPPPPKMVSVRMCDASQLLAGEHCGTTHAKSFVEGRQPTRYCNVCKAPEPAHVSTIADRALPELVSGPSLKVPDSVEEGLVLKASVDFYVDADGGVSGVRVSKSSGNSALDRAMASCVSQRKYKPAVQGGVPRRVPMTQPFTVRT